MKITRVLFGMVLLASVATSSVVTAPSQEELLLLMPSLHAVSSALNAKALGAQTPSSFRKYKYAALVATALNAAHSGHLLYRLRQNSAGNEHAGLFTVLGVLDIVTALFSMRKLWRHARNADQLHMLLASRDIKQQAGVKKWSSAANKQALIDLVSAVAGAVSAQGIFKAQRQGSLTHQSIWIPLFASVAANELTRSLLNDQNVGHRMDSLFDTTLRSNDEYARRNAAE